MVVRASAREDAFELECALERALELPTGEREEGGRRAHGGGWTTVWTSSITPSRGRGMYVCTSKIESMLGDALRRAKSGTCAVRVVGRDASAGARCGISVNENADGDVRSDMLKAFDAIVCEEEVCGPRDVMNAVRAALVGKGVVIPVLDGKLALGRWQGVYFCEFKDKDDRDDTSNEGGRMLIVTLCDTTRKHDGIGVGGGADVARRGTIPAPGRGCHLVTSSAPMPSRVPQAGTATFFIQHTSASLTINENCDPDVRRDLAGALDRIVPESWHETMFEHVEEGPDDMAAHVKTTLVGPSVTVPIARGRLDLGTWQGLYLNEHRNVGGFGRGHARDVVCAVNVEEALAQKTLTVSAGKRGLRDITREIIDACACEDVMVGTVHLFCRHTSASLVVGDSGDAFADAFERALNAIVPERWNSEFFRHTAEGPDDMPGHVKSTIVGSSVTLPIVDGRIIIGNKQRVYLCEHRNVGGFYSGLSRSVTLTLQGARKNDDE